MATPPPPMAKAPLFLVINPGQKYVAPKNLEDGASFAHEIVRPEGLFVITDIAAQITDLGYEAHFLKRRRGGVRLWKHVGRYLNDLTFRLLRRGIDCFTLRAAFGVLMQSN